MQRTLRFLPVVATIAGALLVAAPAQAVVSVTSTGFSYDQSFDSLAISGTTNAWSNDSTLSGWSLFNTAGAAVATYRAGDGASNTGAIYSFGTTGSTERALGGVGSSGFSGFIAAAFANATGSALSGFSLSFVGEQWRDGGNANQNTQSMTMQYGFGADYSTVTWVSAPSFDWASPAHTAATGTALNGNLAANQVAVSGNVTAAWAPGQTLWLRWADINDSGNDHGLAIDNLNLQVTAVPEPTSMLLLLAGLPLIWGLTRHRRRRD